MPFKILVPTDLSESSLPALELAIALGQPLDAVLQLLYVVDVDRFVPLIAPDETDVDQQRNRMLEQAREALHRLAGTTTRAAVLNCFTRLGAAAEEILNHAAEEEVDLVVMATHGRTGLSHVLIGSVAERVVRGARCPVMVVRSERQGKDGQPEPLQAPRRILVPTDLTEGSLPALMETGRMASMFKAEVTVLHVIDIAYATMPLLAAGGKSAAEVQQDMINRAGEALQSFLSSHAGQLNQRVLEAPVLLRMGEAAREIEGAAESTDADLIVLGRHGYRGVRRWLMGSVAEQVVRTAPCAVLTVPISEKRTEG